MDLSIVPTREIALQIGNFSIRWYGVLWALSFWVVWYLAPRLQRYRNLSLTSEQWNTVIVWGVIGALFGGRIGYALFYDPVLFLHPASLFAIWQGGMASHGGFTGVALALYAVLKTYNVSFLAVIDVLVIPIALGLAFGRVGNWINGELFIGNYAWVAVAKDVLVATLCYMLLSLSFAKSTSQSSRHGLSEADSAEGGGAALTAARRDLSSDATLARRLASWSGTTGSVTVIFLLLYSILRFFVEYLRDDPWSTVWGLTRGQLYTLPLLVLGVSLLLWLQKRPQHSNLPIKS